MKRFLIVMLSLLLAASLTLASKESPEIEAAFNALKKGERVQLEKQNEFGSLHYLIMKENHSIPQALYALQEIKSEKMQVELIELLQLLKIHEAKTFKSMYPEHWRFIKGIDYEALLCKEIEALIKVVKEKSSKQPID